LTKPWSNTVLRETVRYALAAARASAGYAGALNLHASASSQSADALPVGSILVLDSDIGVARATAEAAGAGYIAHIAHSLSGAMQILEPDPTIWLLLTEVRVDGEEVADFLAVLKIVNPTLIAMTTTGIHDALIVIRLINEGQILRFIAKPLEPAKLRLALQFALGRHQQLKKQTQLQVRFRTELSSQSQLILARATDAYASSQNIAAPLPGGLAPALLDNKASGGLLRRVFALFGR